jgi:uncharacterized protein (TIGR03083 family)
VTEALAETWESLAEVCHALVTKEWELGTECPGWTVQDQLSHVIGIERALQGEAEPEWQGELGEHVRNDFASGNEKWIAVRRGFSGDAVLAEFIALTQSRLAQLRSLPSGSWSAVGWSPVGDVPMVTSVEVRIFDSWVHEQDVRRALDRPGGTGGRASEIALSRVQSAMPMVVGKRSKAPEGAVVRFVVRGAGLDARDFSIAVQDGRAQFVGSDRAPVVTLGLSAVDFTRLGCGRASWEQVQAAGGMEVEGDTALGQQVLGAMNFMF